MKKKINRFKRLATLRKVDIYKEVNRSNLLENEMSPCLESEKPKNTSQKSF